MTHKKNYQKKFYQGKINKYLLIVVKIFKKIIKDKNVVF